MDVKDELARYGLKVDQYNILRKANGRPACPNALLEAVVSKKLSSGLNAAEDTLYGQLIMTLARIVLNNKAMKHQEESLRMECFSAMMEVIADVERNFDWNHGSKYYSYLFNAMYHSGVHVLEGSNKRRALAEAMAESMADKYMDCGCRVGPSSSTSTSEGIRQRYVALRPGCA
jgi:hypothetical protein